jgi:hypothetical protein
MSTRTVSVESPCIADYYVASCGPMYVKHTAKLGIRKTFGGSETPYRGGDLLRQFRTARVSRLNGPCRPYAVPRFVVAVVILTLDGMPRRWPPAHVGEEVLKTISPALAYLNAPATVVIPAFDRRIVATSLHRAPSAVLGGPSPIAGLSLPNGRPRMFLMRGPGSPHVGSAIFAVPSRGRSAVERC